MLNNMDNENQIRQKDLEKLKRDARFNNGSDITFAVLTILILAALAFDQMHIIDQPLLSSMRIGLHWVNIPRNLEVPIFLLLLAMLWFIVIGRKRQARQLLEAYNRNEISNAKLQQYIAIRNLNFSRYNDDRPWYKVNKRYWYVLLLVLSPFILLFFLVILF